MARLSLFSSHCHVQKIAHSKIIIFCDHLREAVVLSSLSFIVELFLFYFYKEK